MHTARLRYGRRPKLYILTLNTLHHVVQVLVADSGVKKILQAKLSYSSTVCKMRYLCGGNSGGGIRIS